MDELLFYDHQEYKTIVKWMNGNIFYAFNKKRINKCFTVSLDMTNLAGYFILMWGSNTY